IDPIQVIDTLKSTFKELDELLLATAITVALTQPESTNEPPPEDELKKTQEVIAQVVTGSTALVGFLAPHTIAASGSDAATGAESNESSADGVLKHDLYLAQLGDAVAILAGYDAQGQWTTRRLNPPETHEHSVRYSGSEEYRRVVLEAKERALTVEQFLTQHNGSSTSNNQSTDADATEIGDNSFLTRNGRFLGLPVTRAFGDLDWKVEQEARFSVATLVEKSLRLRIDKALGGGQEENGASSSHDETGINNLNDPPYVTADPRISRFVLETRKPQSRGSVGGASDQLLVFLNRASLYTTAAVANQTSSTGSAKYNPYDQALLSDFDLSRVVANALEKGEENCALALANALNLDRRVTGAVVDKEGDEEGLEGSIIVVAL
ncbi:hypothetical protein BGZ98_004571, partial [Dissophora globulifera]